MTHTRFIVFQEISMSKRNVEIMDAIIKFKLAEIFDKFIAATIFCASRKKNHYQLFIKIIDKTESIRKLHENSQPSKYISVTSQKKLRYMLVNECQQILMLIFVKYQIYTFLQLSTVINIKIENQQFFILKYRWIGELFFHSQPRKKWKIDIPQQQYIFDICE